MSFVSTFILALLAIGAGAGRWILGGWSGAGWGAFVALACMAASIWLLGRPPKDTP